MLSVCPVCGLGFDRERTPSCPRTSEHHLFTAQEEAVAAAPGPVKPSQYKKRTDRVHGSLRMPELYRLRQTTGKTGSGQPWHHYSITVPPSIGDKVPEGFAFKFEPHPDGILMRAIRIGVKSEAVELEWAQ